MKAKQAVVCPKCGALNRPTWEFCARCDESLEGVTPSEAAVEPRDAGEEATSSVPGGMVAVAGALAFVVLGLAAWRYGPRMPAAERPSSELFKIASPAPELPSPRPPTGPGEADYEEGRRLMNAGDFAGAVARLALAAAANPGNAEYQSVYAHALWRSGDRDGAIAAHATAAALDPRLQLEYARALDVAGQGPEAARVYEEILARKPDATAVHEDLGRLLFRSREYGKAAAHLREAVESRPDDPVLAQELAYSLDQSGSRAEAAAIYRRVLDQAPQAAVTRGLLAESLAEEGKKEEALAVLQEGLKETPTTPLLQRQLGSVLERSGRPAEAAEAYRAYARLAPNAPDAREIAERAARLEATRKNP